MPCKDAIIKNPLTIHPDATIKDALNIISEHGIRAVPVVNENDVFCGMFSLNDLMSELIPVAASMEGGISNLGFVVGGAGGAAKRVRKLSANQVKTVINHSHHEAVLSPDTITLEVIRRLSKYGSPLPVVDDNNKFVGLVSEQSCLNYLKDVLKQVEAEEAKEASTK